MQVLELRRLQALLQSLRAVSDVRLVLCRFFGSEVRHVSHDANDGQSRSDEADGVEKEHGPAKRGWKVEMGKVWWKKSRERGVVKKEVAS
jgi:hypothetical protein